VTLYWREELMAQLKDIKEATPLNKLTLNQLLELQENLSRLGLYPKQQIDGDYGNLTKAGWAAFKKNNSQNQPDLIGPGSIELLLKATTKPTVTTGATLADKIYNCCITRGYTLDTRPEAVNIIGLEGVYPNGKPNDDAPDKWNDSIGLLTVENSKPKLLCCYVGTTEPGKYYTFNPLNKGGAARLQLGQHKELWIVGKHRGYEAMQQIGKATLVRDKNRNFLRDDTVTVETGNGINLHSTSPKFIPSLVDKFSAGCLVIQKWSEFQTFMKLIKSSTQYKNNKSAKFDFTLLWKDWL
jgi:hypothetical protein